MSFDPAPTTDDDKELAVAAKPSAVSTLGQWIADLGSDVTAVLATCEQFAPRASLRAPLRAGLRHLMHIHPLSEGIEALAMLEVALVLRVTTLLAQPAEELGDETVLRLRAETQLIEELFPAETQALWSLCTLLIERERELEAHLLSEESEPAQARDPLFEKVRQWTLSYVAPEFGRHARELTRTAAFVKNRAQSWST
jgi:hypothetical protein